MLFNKKYDLVFGIGEACSCSQVLRKCHLQFFSYPFDWLFGSDILTRVKILTDDYQNFMNIDDLEDTNQNNKDKKNLCEIYHNKSNDITFNHDFTYNQPLEKSYPEVQKKYNRRIKRQLNQIENSENVLVVYVQTPNNRNIIEDSVLTEVYDLLQKRFPNQNITLSYFFCNHDKKFPEYKMIKNNIIKTELDYDAYNKDFPYVVNSEILQKEFSKIKITGKFMSLKNLLRRYFFVAKCFFKKGWK